MPSPEFLPERCAGAIDCLEGPGGADVARITGGNLPQTDGRERRAATAAAGGGREPGPRSPGGLPSILTLLDGQVTNDALHCGGRERHRLPTAK